MLYCDMFWLLHVAILRGGVHVAPNVMPHTLEQNITSGITDFFMNHEDLTVRISLSTCNSVVQRLVACISSKSLRDVTACPNLSPSPRVCHHSTDVTSCVSHNRVERVVLNIILHTFVLELFVVPSRPECKFLVKDVLAVGHCSSRALASASKHNE